MVVKMKHLLLPVGELGPYHFPQHLVQPDAVLALFVLGDLLPQSLQSLVSVLQKIPPYLKMTALGAVVIVFQIFGDLQGVQYSSSNRLIRSFSRFSSSWGQPDDPHLALLEFLFQLFAPPL